MSRTKISNTPQLARDPKGNELNLHYGVGRGDILLPPHGTNISCSVVKQANSENLCSPPIKNLPNKSIGETEECSAKMRSSGRVMLVKE